ncbi:MAG: hypothetical protein EXS32_02455 [Opitutus sp.]|nr:hypothetical protein [Opitutus sp.]
MSVEQIQREVSQLPEGERRQLAAWMFAQFPPRSIDELVARAEAQAKRGEWTPQPPTSDNIPTGAALDAALRRAKAAGIAC